MENLIERSVCIRRMSVKIWRKKLRHGLAGITIALLASMPARAQGEQKPLSPEEVLSYRSLSENQEFRFSPDGKFIAYTVRDTVKQTSWNAKEDEQTGVPPYANGSTVWIVDTKSGQNRQITRGEMNNWAPAWSPDGRHIAYVSDRDSDHRARVWLYDLRTGKDRKLSEVAVLGGYSPRWTPDGEALLVETLPESRNALRSGGYTEKSGSLDSLPKKSVVATVRLYESNPERVNKTDPGSWKIDQGQGEIALLNIESGRESWLSNGNPVTNSWISPDGNYVAFTVPRGFQRQGSQQQLFDLMVFDRQMASCRLLVKDIRLAYNGGPVTWSPDSTRLAYREEGPDGVRDGFVVDIHGGKIRNVTLFEKVTPAHYLDGGLLWDSASESLYFRYEWALWHTRADGGGAKRLVGIPNHRIDPVAVNSNQIWSPDGGHSVIVSTQETNSNACGFFQVDLATGKYERRFEDSRSIGGVVCLARDLVVSPDRKQLAFPSQDAEHAEDIWISSAELRELRQLTHVNPQFEKHDLGTARLVEWWSMDGEVLHGALLLPAGYQVEHRYPLVVWVYGSSFFSSKINQFGVIGPFAGLDFLHLFTTRGYWGFR